MFHVLCHSYALYSKPAPPPFLRHTPAEPLPFNFYKDMQFEYVVEKNFCKLNRAPTTVVNMHKFNRGFDILQKKDERIRIKHDI